MSSTTVWLWSCRRETLTATPTPLPPGRSCQAMASAHACCSTQRPTSTIAPDSSATPMNAPGWSNPRAGWFQRTSASAFATVRVTRSTTGR